MFYNVLMWPCLLGAIVKVGQSQEVISILIYWGFFENGSKLKIPLEIIPPLKQELLELKPQRDALLHQEQL